MGRSLDRYGARSPLDPMPRPAGPSVDRPGLLFGTRPGETPGPGKPPEAPKPSRPEEEVPPRPGALPEEPMAPPPGPRNRHHLLLRRPRDQNRPSRRCGTCPSL
jgi:hypothetical protein